MGLCHRSYNSVLSKNYIKTLFNTCYTLGGAQFAQSWGHAVTCWLLLYSYLHESSAHLAIWSFYHLDSWIPLSLILSYSLLSIYSLRCYMEKIQDVTPCCLEITDGVGAEWAASCANPSLPTSSVLVWHTDVQKMCLGIILCFTLWLSQGYAEQGWAFLTVVTIWTSLRWSPPAFAEDVSQWGNQCWDVEAQSDENWKNGYGRVCGSVLSTRHFLAGLKDLLILLWLAHSFLAWGHSCPVSHVWPVALIVASAPWAHTPIPH